VNPFDLPGPQFLVLYVTFCALVVVAAIFHRRASESRSEMPTIDTTDPYLIAYLRGGSLESVRVATVSLFDRRLLKVEGDTKPNAILVTAGEHDEDLVRRPLEKAILHHFADPGATATSIFGDDERIDLATDAYDATLVEAGLLPSVAVDRVRAARIMVAIGLMWAVAGIKILVALGRGRTNIEFLVAIAVIAAVAAFLTGRTHRTALGDRMVADLRELFRGLSDRAGSLRAGGATSEASLLAGVFGLRALPPAQFAFARRLYPRASGGSSCGGSCGSGCGGCGGS